jgi:hypothetical protein
MNEDIILLYNSQTKSMILLTDNFNNSKWYNPSIDNNMTK